VGCARDRSARSDRRAPVGDQIAGLKGVAFGGGRFVATVNAVGEEVLRVMTSSDGLTWRIHELTPPGGGTTLGISRIHFQRDRFVFFADFWGGGAWVFTSSNGTDWSSSRLEGDRVFAAEFASDGDLTLYVGDSNSIASSADLESFTPVTTTSGSFSYMDVAAGNGRFVATANGFVDGQTSPDTVAWEGLPELQMHTIEFGRGFFAAFSYPSVRTSTDGVTFTEQVPTGDRSGWSPRFAGGRFVTLGISGAEGMPFAASTDAVNWSPFGTLPLPEVPSGATSAGDYLQEVACSTCTCVFVGLTVVGNQSQDPWTQDNLPLIATARVLEAP
jgi:hypothetical protein